MLRADPAIANDRFPPPIAVTRAQLFNPGECPGAIANRDCNRCKNFAADLLQIAVGVLFGSTASCASGIPSFGSSA
jgi:hypothetical protein